MSGRRFSFGKTGRVARVEPAAAEPAPARAAARAQPQEDRTVELKDYAAPRRVLPFADVKATVQLPRPAVIPPPPSAPPARPQREARPWRRWLTGIAITVAVLLLDALAAWLIVRRPS